MGLIPRRPGTPSSLVAKDVPELFDPPPRATPGEDPYRPKRLARAILISAIRDAIPIGIVHPQEIESARRFLAGEGEFGPLRKFWCLIFGESERKVDSYARARSYHLPSSWPASGGARLGRGSGSTSRGIDRPRRDLAAARILIEASEALGHPSDSGRPSAPHPGGLGAEEHPGPVHPGGLDSRSGNPATPARAEAASGPVSVLPGEEGDLM